MRSFLIEVLRLCAWLALLMIIFVPLERMFSLRKQRAFRKSFGIDLAYYFLSSLLPKLVLVLPLTLVAGLMHRLAPGGFYVWMASLPVGIRVAAAMVVGEMGAYWAHRWMHQVPFLWRFHAIHHSPEEIDWLVTTRAHPVDMVFTRLCALVPMYALGLAQPLGNSVDSVPVLLTIVGTIWGFFIHANLNWRLGWFEWLVASPAFHHWHHTNDGPELVNKNYAPMLPWVDRLFGTFYLPTATWPAKYGIDQPMAPGMAGQLMDPLLKS